MDTNLPSVINKGNYFKEGHSKVCQSKEQDDDCGSGDMLPQEYFVFRLHIGTFKAPFDHFV